MRRLSIIAAVLALFWAGGWLAGSAALRKGAGMALDRLATQGRLAEVAAIRSDGFPAAFALTLEGLALADPAAGFGWQAPELRLRAAMWQPWMVTAAFPARQWLELRGQPFTLEGLDETASLRLRPLPDLPLAEVLVAGNGLVLQPAEGGWQAGWQAGADSLALALRADPQQAAGYVLTLDAAGIRPGTPPADPAALPDLPERIDRLHALVALRLTAPLDRHMGEARPRLAGLSVQESELVWGSLVVQATGTLAPDEQGLAAGRIEATIHGWDRLPPLLVAHGAIAPGLAPTLHRLLAGLAAGQGTTGAGAAAGEAAPVHLALVMRGGRMSLGPLPLGPAPRMELPPA